MSKASEYAQVKAVAKNAAQPKWESVTKAYSAVHETKRPKFTAGINDDAELICDGWLPWHEVPEFIKWLKETFED